jgi:hypothetical protein
MKTSTFDVPQFDSAWPRFVAASAEEIQQAEELRRQIEQRYLTTSHQPRSSHWYVGAD